MLDMLIRNDYARMLHIDDELDILYLHFSRASARLDALQMMATLLFDTLIYMMLLMELFKAIGNHHEDVHIECF